MIHDREKISTGPSEELAEAPSGAEVEKIAEKIGAPSGKRDTLPLGGE